MSEAIYQVQRLSASKHVQEWTQDSGVSEAIALLNIESLTEEELNKRINPQYPIKTDGWWCRGVNWRNGQPMGLFYGQGKPDEKHLVDPAKGKKAKYMTASGMEPDAIFLAMPDKHYWAKVYADESIVRVWTEGAKKAAAGLTLLLATIALTGVWNWGKDGKLAPEVERWAQPGTKHVIAFDSDYRDKPSCRQAIIQFAKLLTAKGCEVLIATWSQEDKGMDDFIVKNGGDAFGEAIANAQTVQQWEKQFKKSASDRTEKIPPADKMAREIAEEYRKRLEYNNEIGQWMRYEADYPGMWSTETDDCIESIVFNILDGKGVIGYNSHSYVTNIVKTLRCLLLVRKWSEPSPKDLLPFRNGVLDVKSGERLPHDPSYRFTWQLPREHNEKATDWSTIDAFLDHLSGFNSAIKEVLICYCNAVLKGRGDLQKFLHLIGLAGSGKGTFARLITDLIGEGNIHSSTLEDWCSNRFESANAYRKRLVVFWDEDKQTGKLGKFLSLTGGDWIKAEEKGKRAFQYRYDGMTLVMSNEPIFGGGAVARIARRVVTVGCNQPVAQLERRDLNVEFQPELDAFTNYLLSIPDKQVTKTLMGLHNIPEITAEFWENRVRTDSIASWLNDWVIYDVTAITPMGCNRNEGEGGNQVTTLFGSYSQYCQQTGSGAKSNKNFSPDLMELCRSVLNWEVERKVTKSGKFIRGLRLRHPGIDDYIPTHDYTLLQRVTGGDGSGDGSECLYSTVFTNGDGSSPICEKKLEINLDVLDESTYVEELALNPSPTSQCPAGKGFDPSPNPSPNPSPSEDLGSTFKAGDEVEFFGESDKQWHTGRIATIETESGYFVKAVIKYWAFKKSRQQVICREDWLRAKI